MDSKPSSELPSDDIGETLGWPITLTSERTLVHSEDQSPIELYVCTPAAQWAEFTHLVAVKKNAEGAKYILAVRIFHGPEDARTAETQPAVEVVFE